MKIECVAFTHNGLVRANNEDCVLCDGWMRNQQMESPALFSIALEESGKRLFALADGLGGHSSGEVASQFSLSKLCSLIADLPQVSEASLADALRETHKAVFNVSTADPSYKGMGATVAGLAVDGAGGVYLFHVGDSRIYRREDRFLQQLTADDRLEAVGYGEVDPDVQAGAPLLQCLGGLTEFSEIEPHVARFEMSGRPETFLICSDGLSDMVLLDEMEESFSQSHEATARALFNRAREAGAKDNISILIVELTPDSQLQANSAETVVEAGATGDPV